MPYLFGTDTRTIILKSESHKLFEEFEVAAAQTVAKGQPVVISGNELVSPAGIAATTQQIIGISMHDAIAGELITVMVKGWAITFVECETALLVAGPVKLGGVATFNPLTGYVMIDDAAVSHLNQIGWAIEGGVAIGDIVRVIWL
jgi:hypothetical protein